MPFLSLMFKNELSDTRDSPLSSDNLGSSDSTTSLSQAQTRRSSSGQPRGLLCVTNMSARAGNTTPCHTQDLTCQRNEGLRRASLVDSVQGSLLAPY